MNEQEQVIEYISSAITNNTSFIFRSNLSISERNWFMYYLLSNTAIT